MTKTKASEPSVLSLLGSDHSGLFNFQDNVQDGWPQEPDNYL